MKEEEEEEKWVVGVRDDRKHRLSISKRSDNILTRLLATVANFCKRLAIVLEFDVLNYDRSYSVASPIKK